MTDPMSPEIIAASTPGRWGVWNQHTRTWQVPPHLDTERVAWHELLDADVLYPWELEVREDKTHPEPEKWVLCPECLGTGVCDNCDRNCTRCDGNSEVGVKKLADHERRRMIRLGYLDAPPAQPATQETSA